MRVLMLSWEYPPKSVGGLAQHVYDLTSALADIGEEVDLITCGAAGAPDFERVNGVNVYRVTPYNISAPDFVTWVPQFNIALLEKAIPLINEIGTPHVIHAHDWLVAYAARALKHGLRVPLVATIHATEYGRNCGLHNNIQRHISDIEWWLCYEAWRVIVCSHYMEGEVRHVFQVPADKLRVIPNGVNPENFTIKKQSVSRNDFASPDEKIVFYVGRLVREKGVQVLLDAVPHILSFHPRTKFIIAGKGPYLDELRRQASHLGIADRVYFTGYVDDELRNSLYSWADVAVFPSLYEPFGIVALEAMAARTPVVVADTGGLSEIVVHGIDGLKTYPGNPRSLADMILKLLCEPELRETLVRNAYHKVKRQFNWREIARETRGVYQEVWEAHRSSVWAHELRHVGLWGRVSRIFGRYA